VGKYLQSCVLSDYITEGKEMFAGDFCERGSFLLYLYIATALFLAK